MSRNGKNGKKSRRWLWVVVILVILVGAGLGIQASLKPDNTIDPSRLVEIERGDIARSVVATGKIEPRSKVDVKSKASGIVKRDLRRLRRIRQVRARCWWNWTRRSSRRGLREAKATLQAAQAPRQAAAASFERNKVEAEAPDLPFLKSAMERARTASRRRPDLDAP